MNNFSLYPVIMAGGTGSRLWPLSRVLYPKQFLSLAGDKTMLQETISRLDGLECESPVVVCNEEHRFVVAEQLREINKLTKNIILEPVGRNTAPAVSLAALTILNAQKILIENDVNSKIEHEDPLMLVLAADHVIQDNKAFRKAVINAIPYATAGKLVTFGIVPTGPETGYGYIKRGDTCSLQPQIDITSKINLAFHVASFIEKPNIVDANQYIKSGEFYWNSGMFLFRASKYLEELEKFRPDIIFACTRAFSAINTDLDFVRISRDFFSSCPAESIDYAVMEKTSEAIVVPLDAGWSDVGSWSSLWEISEKDKQGNTHHGDVISIDSKNDYVYADSCLVATIGVTDLVIIQTKDAVLVADRNQVQNVKNIVAQLKKDGRHEHHIHREVFRPWGKYDSIDQGERYQVKRITVKPGEALSLQMHHHRAEHWVVVAGTAKVTVGSAVKIISENESIYIPLGETHCLENPGKIPLDIIEVRSGAYLDEDDIVRFDDKYGRL